MDFVLSKLEKDAFTVFTFSKLKVGRIINILIGHAWTIEDHLLNINSKINQKAHSAKNI